jgi:hypothetical protein
VGPGKDPGKWDKKGDLGGISEYPFNPVIIGPIERMFTDLPKAQCL